MATVKGGKFFAVASSVLVYDSQAVPANVESTVATYTASGSDKSITKIIASGNGNGKWNVEVDSVVIMTFRTANGDRTRDIDFVSPLLLSDGSTLDVKVEHCFTGDTLDFESTVMGY